MQELWLPIPEWEGFYEASNWGRIKSLARLVMMKNGQPKTLRERILKPAFDAYGYAIVSLSRSNVAKTVTIHSLVARTFLGPRPEGLLVLHGPSGYLDNSIGNLSYGTPKQNKADELRDGTRLFGVKHGRSKLSPEQVLLARTLAATGQPGIYARLARQWGVSKKAVYNAIKGKTWASVPTS